MNIKSEEELDNFRKGWEQELKTNISKVLSSQEMEAEVG